jgi:hypothetical protein
MTIFTRPPQQMLDLKNAESDAGVMFECVSSACLTLRRRNLPDPAFAPRVLRRACS